MPSDNQVISALTRNLEDTLDLTNMFVKMLQEEVVTNANFRGKTEQALDNIRGMVDNLHATLTEHDGLLNRMTSMEYSIKETEKEVQFIKNKIDTIKAEEKAEKAEQEAEKAQKQERLWGFFIQNSTVILTWLGIIIGLGLQFLCKKFGWF